MSALTIFTNHLLLDLWQDGTPYSRILTALSFGALTLMGSICGSLIRARQGPRTVALLSLPVGLPLLPAPPQGLSARLMMGRTFDYTG